MHEHANRLSLIMFNSLKLDINGGNYMNINGLQVFGNIFLVRWTARILSGIFAALIVILLIIEGANPFSYTSHELVLLLALLSVWIGFIVSWLWEGIGGIMITGGGIVFYLVVLLVSGNLPGGWILPASFIPGFLFLYCWWKTSPYTKEV